MFRWKPFKYHYHFKAKICLFFFCSQSNGDIAKPPIISVLKKATFTDQFEHMFSIKISDRRLVIHLFISSAFIDIDNTTG